VAPGANRRLTPWHVERRRADVSWADIVLCQLETPLETVTRALEIARSRQTLAILNPAPVRDLDASVWPLVDYLTPNAGEASRLSGVPMTGTSSATDAARALLARGVGAVVVTLGEDGAVACGRDGELSVGAFAVTAVDTTAAGDAFNGGLAVALAERVPLQEALRFASAAAALTCTKRGARPSLPSRVEVDAFLLR
jgi:ribokinase